MHDLKEYSGQYKNGLKTGNGIYTWPSGKEYRGQWLDGNQQGYGVIINKKTGKAPVYCLFESGKRIEEISIEEFKKNYVDKEFLKKILE